MSQVRRVSRPCGTLRTRRPVSAAAPVDHGVELACTATVTHLFPAKVSVQSPYQAAQITNIFADLAQDDAIPCTSPLGRARARAAARLPGADVPHIANIFDEDCPDVSDAAMARMAAAIKARPRKLESARVELLAGHAERAEQARGLTKLGTRSAAGLAAAITLVAIMMHGLPVPHA